jgi:small multidrug resistance pump
MPAPIFLVCAIVFNAAANYLLKLGAVAGFTLADWSPAAILRDNWRALLGLALFALNVFFYFFALRKLPLSIAYPVMVGGTFILVNLCAAWGLGERVSGIGVLGYALIVAGVTVVSMVR